MSVSTLSWTFSAAIALAAVPVSGTVAGGQAAGQQFERHAATQLTKSQPARAGSNATFRITGSVAIRTRKLDLETLVLSDFGDEPVYGTR